MNDDVFIDHCADATDDSISPSILKSSFIDRR